MEVDSLYFLVTDTLKVFCVILGQGQAQVENASVLTLQPQRQKLGSPIYGSEGSLTVIRRQEQEQGRASVAFLQKGAQGKVNHLNWLAENPCRLCTNQGFSSCLAPARDGYSKEILLHLTVYMPGEVVCHLGQSMWPVHANKLKMNRG